MVSWCWWGVGVILCFFLNLVAPIRYLGGFAGVEITVTGVNVFADLGAIPRSLAHSIFYLLFSIFFLISSFSYLY